MRAWMFARGWLAIVFAVVSFVFLVMPIPAAVTLTFALYAGWDAFLLYYAGRDSALKGERWRPMAIESLFAWVIAALALVSPLFSMAPTRFLIGLWAVAAGLFALASFKRDRKELVNPGAFIGAAAAALVLGAIFLIWEANSVRIFATIWGVYLALYGGLLLAASGGFGRRWGDDAVFRPREPVAPGGRA